ncbi:hypothetical protein DSO57_1015252 [Entomophthora muscae]|uniref:Uncharacterized protein n=1 Tax=Entomophthora muscae TaxID=34485 RepID=A0ACC2T543_9FUNG|nr:hypothetical protein DSO57_1015252 [Entomophthora muscae]
MIHCVAHLRSRTIRWWVADQIATKPLLHNNLLPSSGLLRSNNSLRSNLATAARKAAVGHQGTSKDSIWAHLSEENLVKASHTSKGLHNHSNNSKRDIISGNTPSSPSNPSNDASGNLEVISLDEEAIPEKKMCKVPAPRTQTLITHQEEEEFPTRW